MRDTGITVRDTGYGEAVVVVLREGCFFSELRVITLITKKYSILKTTTTTGKTPLAGCCVALLSKSAGVAGAVSAVRRSLCVVCLYKL